MNESVSKWGDKQPRLFSARDDAYLSGLLAGAGRLCDLYAERFGVDLFVCYGVLLGFTRSGDFIGHDDDFDLAYISRQSARQDVLLESRRIVEGLLQEGFEVKLDSYGQYKIFLRDGKVRYKWEIFVGWREDSSTYLYFGIDGGIEQEAFLPLGRRDFRGVALPVPNEPARVCEVIYGKGWQTPDPGFRYELTPEKWRRFSFLFSRPNLSHWDTYYRKHDGDAPWSILPSQFAAFVANETAVGRLLEVGCGNGRDAIFFASVGFEVVAIDYSAAAIQVCTDRAKLTGVPVDVRGLNIFDIVQATQFMGKEKAAFDCVYARFFLHAISEVGESDFWRLAATVLRPGGRCFVEFRTNEDERARLGEKLSDSERVDGHYRRFVDLEAARRRAEAAGLSTIFQAAGTGMAAFRGEDPHVGRFVLRRD